MCMREYRIFHDKEFILSTEWRINFSYTPIYHLNFHNYTAKHKALMITFEYTALSMFAHETNSWLNKVFVYSTNIVR